MELVNKYVDEVTVIADFWIANNQNEIRSIVNEGISIEKSKIYLNQWFINVILAKKAYDEIELFAKDWQKKYPKAVITKGSGRVEAYDLRFKKAVPKGEFMVLEFAGQPPKE